MHNLVPHDESIHGKISTGPVDDQREIQTQDLCPECGERLWMVFEQMEYCLLTDHYWCDGCEGVFVDDEVNDGGR